MVHWDITLLGGNAFYLPGSQECAGSLKEKADYNLKPPAFIILKHIDSPDPFHPGLQNWVQMQQHVQMHQHVQMQHAQQGFAQQSFPMAMQH